MTMSLWPQQNLGAVRRGDIFALGRHRLACIDATGKVDVARLFDGRRPTLVVTSPPYADARKYNDPIPCWDSMMMGALNGHKFAHDVQLLVNLGVLHRKNEWVPYWWEWIQGMRTCSWRIFAQYIWSKNRGVPRFNDGRLKSAHELLFHLNKTSVPTNDWMSTAQPGRVRLGANDYAAADGSKRRTRKKIVTAPTKTPGSVLSVLPVNHAESTGHPAQMPVALASFLLRTWRKDGCVAYDPFGGSGTTLLACEAEGVDGLASEISPAYVQLAIDRWRKMHPDKPVTRVT